MIGRRQDRYAYSPILAPGVRGFSCCALLTLNRDCFSLSLSWLGHLFICINITCSSSRLSTFSSHCDGHKMRSAFMKLGFASLFVTFALAQKSGWGEACE